MTWGAYIQPGLDEKIDQIGSKLSVVINCPVHYPAYGKRMYECKCGVIFPVYMLTGDNWNVIIKKHNDEKEMMERMGD